MTVPDCSERSNARMRVIFRLRTLGAHVLRGHEPLHRTVTFAAFGAVTENTVTRAPRVVNTPRIRTVGNGCMILRDAVSCRTCPVVGTGVGAGGATSNTGGGGGAGTGVAIMVGTGAGVGVGVSVGAGPTAPVAAD